jgi:hypothetical protein
MRARQAARATWLSGGARPARRLALALWTADQVLDVSATDAAVTAALSEPTQLPGTERRGATTDCTRMR